MLPTQMAAAPRGDMEGHVGLSRYCGAGADCAAPELGCLKPMAAAAGVCRPAKIDTCGNRHHGLDHPELYALTW